MKNNSNLMKQQQSFIDHSILLKGGSVTIQGNIHGNYHWGNLMNDVIVSKAINYYHARYKKIVCVNFDRRDDDVRSCLSLPIASQNKPNGNTSNNADKYYEDDKLIIMHHRFINNNNKNEEIFDTLSNIINENISSDNTSSLLITINSISELILTRGVKYALYFLKKMVSFCELNENNSSNSMNILLLFTIHESLHSSSLIHQLQSLCQTNIKIVPNNSHTLSSEVAAEVQFIRKSSSGRVSESIELFTIRNGLFYPLHFEKNDNNVTNININNENNDEKKDIVSEVVVRNIPSLKMAPRLITFDSTDP
eukprot:gene17237-23765_t